MSESVGIERETIVPDPELAGAESAPDRVGGVSVKEAAQLVRMPVSTMYDWVNRRWVRTIVGLSERGKEQRLVPWSEIERLRGGAKETLLQQSGRMLDSGPESEPIRDDSEATGTGSEPVGAGSGPIDSRSATAGIDPSPIGSGSESTRFSSDSVGIDWKLVAKAEVRRVRDLSAQVQFLQAHLAKAEARAEQVEKRAEQEGRELRLLIAQSVQAQQQTAAALNGIEERMALPAPKKAPWWTPWRRG